MPALLWCIQWQTILHVELLPSFMQHAAILQSSHPWICRAGEPPCGLLSGSFACFFWAALETHPGAARSLTQAACVCRSSLPASTTHAPGSTFCRVRPAPHLECSVVCELPACTGLGQSPLCNGAAAVAATAQTAHPLRAASVGCCCVRCDATASTCELAANDMRRHCCHAATHPQA